MRDNLAGPDAFAEVMKMTNITGLGDAELASARATCHCF